MKRVLKWLLGGRSISILRRLATHTLRQRSSVMLTRSQGLRRQNVSSLLARVPTLTIEKSVFAPIALLIRYDDIEEAIKIANGTKYGLGASVFGPHQDLCLEVARELECGMVSINDFGVFYVSSNH